MNGSIQQTIWGVMKKPRKVSMNIQVVKHDGSLNENRMEGIGTVGCCVTEMDNEKTSGNVFIIGLNPLSLVSAVEGILDATYQAMKSDENPIGLLLYLMMLKNKLSSYAEEWLNEKDH